MPIIRGDAKVITVMVGGKDQKFYIWPKSMADEKYITVARASADCEDVAGSDGAVMYIHRMARKTDGKPFYESAEDVYESLTSAEVERLFAKISETDDEIAKELDVGNP